MAYVIKSNVGTDCESYLGVSRDNEEKGLYPTAMPGMEWWEDRDDAHLFYTKEEAFAYLAFLKVALFYPGDIKVFRVKEKTVRDRGDLSTLKAGVKAYRDKKSKRR